MRLALALGLPLAVGCKTAPAPEPPPGPGTAQTAPQADPALCPFEHVRERVCGTVYDDGSYPKVSAPAPHDICPTKVAELQDFERNSMIDGWRVDEQDPFLGNFEWDLASSQSYTVNNGVREGEPRCCYQRCTALPAIATPRAAVPAGMKEYEECWPAPEQTAYPAPGAPRCPIALRTRLWFPDGAVDPLDDAPFTRATDGDYCCYKVASLHECPPNTFKTERGCEQPNPGGRPLRDVDGVVTAAARSTSTWLTSTRPSAELSPEARAYAAAAWTREAAYEHASVAAFARLSLDLLAHAAPPELLDSAHVAARDEIRHAQLCYGIASAFAERPIGPGPLAISQHARALTLEDLAVECFRDGCVNETVAALAVMEGARLAATASLRETLTAIGTDETAHAELSYRILDWALATGGAALHARLTAELALVHAELATTQLPAAPHADHDEGSGLLHPSTAASLRRRVLAEVVIPCTEALLGRHA